MGRWLAQRLGRIPWLPYTADWWPCFVGGIFSCWIRGHLDVDEGAFTHCHRCYRVKGYRMVRGN